MVSSDVSQQEGRGFKPWVLDLFVWVFSRNFGSLPQLNNMYVRLRSGPRSVMSEGFSWLNINNNKQLK